MTQTKTLKGLALAIAVVGLASTFLLWRQRQSSAGGTDAELLFPELEDQVNEVAAIEVSDGDQLVTLRKDADGWKLVERGGYPAKFDRVKQVVLGLSEIKIEEPKTSKPENHAKLGVEDPTAANAESKRVVLRSAEGTTLVDVIVGKPVTGRGQATYFRRQGEPQAYQCLGRVDARTDPSSWIDREILRLDSKRVQQVSIRHANGEEVVLEKTDPSGAQFELQNVPAGRAEKYAGVGNAVGTSLASLQLDDVRPAGEVDFDAEPVAETEFLCADGLVVTVQTAKADEKTWARFDVRYEEKAAPADPDLTEGEEGPEAPPPVDPGPDPGAVKREGEELAARLSPWAFAIPDYKVQSLAKPMEELLAELPSEEEDAEAVDGAEEGEGAEESLSIEDLLKLDEEVEDTDGGADESGVEDNGSEAPADPPGSDSSDEDGF